MSRSQFSRIWHVAVGELQNSIRTRKALVVLALYLVFSVSSMIGTISLFSKLEGEVANLLQLPKAEQVGSMSQQLWESPVFLRMVRSSVKDPTVFEYIRGYHPVVLAYAWFALFLAPLLAVLSAGGRVSDELRTKSARFALSRVSRTEWTLGKFCGQMLQNAIALVVSILAVWAVCMIMLKAHVAWELFASMCEWGVKVWIYSFAWLGIASGISHMTESPSRAVCFGILAIALFAALPPLLQLSADAFSLPWLVNFSQLSPNSVKDMLWRGGTMTYLVGTVHFFALGCFYLAVGHSVMKRKDI